MKTFAERVADVGMSKDWLEYLVRVNAFLFMLEHSEDPEIKRIRKILAEIGSDA